MFNASLSATSNLPVYVRYQTLDGTAVAGVDYNTNYGLFTIPAGTVSRQLPLISAIRGNTLVQSNRFFYLNLFSATNATLSRTQVVATIVDDDFLTITATNIALFEGNSGITNAVFNITLTPPSTSPVTVDYQTLDGTASAGSDYGARAGTLRFDPGITNIALSVPVYGDTLPEMDEAFFLLLSQPSGAVLGLNQVRATILNDDPLPSLALSGLNWVGQDLHLQFASINGGRYRVERSLNLSAQLWSAVADNVLGTGGLVDVTDPAAGPGPQGFYRLVLLP
jgi:chitinase